MRIDPNANNAARHRRNARKLSKVGAITPLTDSSTGTSGGDTIPAVTNTATAANAIATLAAKLNEVLATLR